MAFTPGIQGCFNIQKLTNVFHHIKKLEKKNHMIISVYAEKDFDKIQHPFMIKTLSILGLEVNFLNLIKNTLKNLQLTSYLVVRNLKFSH